MAAAELCPLLSGDIKDIREGWPIDVPETCLIQCGELMDKASHDQKGEWDDFLRGEPIPDGDIEFSHDAVGIVSLGQRAARFYVVVDQVTMEHDWIEIGGTTYTFSCPHSDI